MGSHELHFWITNSSYSETVCVHMFYLHKTKNCNNVCKVNSSKLLILKEIYTSSL